MSTLAEILTRWEPVIGLEVHVQLATDSKAFSSSGVSFGQEPNTLTDPVVLGLPGALPVYNRRAAELALLLGLATRSTIDRDSRFDRKHYFYPDLPKGYQITQNERPICVGGFIDVIIDDELRSIPLTRIHLEEDAGKLTHRGATSLVDLNRAGVPLVEVVSEPEMHSADEAAEFMRALHRLIRWLGVGEGDMEKGQLRCDANVSVRRRGATEFGTRTELKNINSFRFVHNAIENEIMRQVDLLESGGRVMRETRLWDADVGASQPMRSKELADDYRYFPDPDLPPLVIDDAMWTTAQANQPELPAQRYLRLRRDLGLPVADAAQLVVDRGIGDYFDATLSGLPNDPGAAKLVANWMLSSLQGTLNSRGANFATSPFPATSLAELLALILDGTISGKIAKDVFDKSIESGVTPGAIVERDGLRQVSDEGALVTAAQTIIAANAGMAQQYREGKASLLGFFVGQLIKATGGKANPKLGAEIMKRLLSQAE